MNNINTLPMLLTTHFTLNFYYHKLGIFLFCFFRYFYIDQLVFFLCVSEIIIIHNCDL